VSYFLLCIKKNYSTNKASTKPKLPTAVSRDINTSGIVEEGRSSPDCLDENSSSSNVSSSSRDRSPSPEEVFVEDLNLTRSNNPVELDAPLITMTVADQDHVKGLVAFYPTSKIRHCTYPERTWEIIPWVKQYNLTDNRNDPFGDFHTILSHINDPVLHRFPVGKYNRRSTLSAPFPLPALHERQLKKTHAIAAFIHCSIHEPPF
jgi:hypothetical protein